MSEDVPVSHTTQRYSSLATAYIQLFGNVERAEPEDYHLITHWVQGLNGPVLDAGCGPGQWTQVLHGPDHPATGVDMVPEFLEHATANFPGCSFQQADIAALPFPDETFSGILSWYSIIHTPPRALTEVLKSFARVLEPGGQLLLGFFAGNRVEAFDHKVAQAWYWSPEELSFRLSQEGFEVTDTVVRTNDSTRTHGHLLAIRR
ncbi:class I SAM-dependent methyltransferase [Glutamicibacter sp. JC586]|uniref:class I SAM-dependent methyltransferase n=1 Tax=Glutamicibacter sp. JC586 TaxID=2590552 RepID=UPI0013595D77|nr:class I SAM-dependent methyltransferase [Glutamicibacter sp. JC586]